MEDSEAVSCLLCLQPDEYGAMVKVCLPQNSIPPSPEKVVCRRCLAALIDAADKTDEGVPGEAEVSTDNRADLATAASAEGEKTDD